MDINDPIFKLIVGVKPLPDQSICNLCDLAPEVSVNCQFCGNLFCDNCCYKKMRYPKGLDSGQICKICDRKFMMYKEYTEFKDIMTIQDKDIE